MLLLPLQPVIACYSVVRPSVIHMVLSCLLCFWVVTVYGQQFGAIHGEPMVVCHMSHHSTYYKLDICSVGSSSLPGNCCAQMVNPWPSVEDVALVVVLTFLLLSILRMPKNGDKFRLDFKNSRTTIYIRRYSQLLLVIFFDDASMEIELMQTNFVNLRKYSPQNQTSYSRFLCKTSQEAKESCGYFSLSGSQKLKQFFFCLNL